VTLSPNSARRLRRLPSRQGKVLSGLCTVLFLLPLFLAALPPLAASASEFSFLKGLFVREVKGYGMYTEEPSSRFEKGSRISVYLEIDGFQNLKKDNGYEVHLSLDLLVKDDKGNVGIEQKDVVTSDLILKSPWRDFFFTVNIDLAELPPGKYTLGFVATDRTSDKKASYDMDIEIY
jgi:hypothetical protein